MPNLVLKIAGTVHALIGDQFVYAIAVLSYVKKKEDIEFV